MLQLKLRPLLRCGTSAAWKLNEVWWEWSLEQIGPCITSSDSSRMTHHSVVSVPVGVVDECCAEHWHGSPLLLYPYLLSEHSLLSLLSLLWLKAGGPPCVSLPHSTFTWFLFSHFPLWLITRKGLNCWNGAASMHHSQLCHSVNMTSLCKHTDSHAAA